MKKYFINENWEIEEFEDKSDLFLLVIEQDIPTCSYIYKYDVSPETIQPDYLRFIEQYQDSCSDGYFKVHLIKVPNTPQICQQVELANSEHKGTTEEAIEAINAMLNRADCEILESWSRAPLTEKKHKKRKKPFDSVSYTSGCIGLNMDFFNSHFGTGELGETTCGESDCFNSLETNDSGNGSGGDGAGLGESLLEAKYDDEPTPTRYIKRYYIRPQNIFCSKKSDILKALVKDVGENNCSVYSLKSLADHDDVHLLKPSDIIYYYDEGILYDKNHVKVMDYDLNVKHEEDRPRFNPDTASDAKFDDVYEDRLVENLTEDLNTCIICGEEYEGYGNNPAPVADKGSCCDACNLKFVIPARLEAGRQQYETN